MAPKTRSGNGGNSTKKDFVALLPKEIVLFVLGYLDPSDLLQAAQTSKFWRKQAEDNLLWKNKCERAGLTYCLNSQNEDMLKRLSKKSGFIYSVWKASFLRPYRIEKNFRTKRPEVTKVEKCHFSDNLRLSVRNNVIVSSSSNAMHVSSALTGKTQLTLAGHTGKVRAIQINKDFVFSGSWDKTVRVWDVNTGECVHVLRGHTGPVLCLHVHGGIVVSGSQDTTLRLWDFKEGELLGTLTRHTGGVTCVQSNENLLVSGGNDWRVKVWNPETGECLRTIVTGRINSFKLVGNIVVIGGVTGGSRNIIKIWDVNTGVLRKTLYDYFSNFEIQGNMLVGFNHLENKCKIWNILTNSCLQTLESAGMGSIQIDRFELNDKFVVTTAGFDGKVKLWDVKTGAFIRDLFWLKSGGQVVNIRMEDSKIVCAVQVMRLDNLKKLDIFVLNLDMNDVK